LRASGQITERMLLFTAVNCVFAYVALTLMLPFLHLEYESSWRSGSCIPLYLSAAPGCWIRRLPAAAWRRQVAGQARGPAIHPDGALVVLMVGCARA